MKKILIISTGGTICSRLIDGCRRLAPDVSESTVVKNFYNNSKYASLSGGIFENSGFLQKTLSENMTFQKLEGLIEHIRGIELCKYSGIVILHGTDTLAYTASLLAMVCSDTPTPIMLVSGDAPPDMPSSNANDNFAKAVELLLSGIAPNVYVPYRNSNGEMILHLASLLMQSPSFSSDFYSAKHYALDELDSVSKNRKPLPFSIKHLEPSVLMIQPYVNLDYSRIDLDGITAVAHGSYHSGTFCTNDGKYSLVSLAHRCKEHGIPLFVAPCTLGEQQYESVYEALKECDLTPASMTLEMLYVKLSIALSVGLHGNEVKDFVLTDFNSETVCQ